MNALATLAARFSAAAKPRERGFVGVHFGGSNLHVAQLTRGEDDGFRLSAHASAALIGGRDAILNSRSATKRVVRRALSAAGCSGKRVMSTMPMDQVRLVSVSYPASGPDTEGATIAGLMADRVEGDLSDYVLDYVPVRTTVRDGERLCLVAVCKKDDVVAYLDTLAASGLTVEALEVAPLSIRRLIGRMRADSDIENVLVVNVGPASTHLTLLSGRRLLSNQEIDFGTTRLAERVAKVLDVSAEVAWDLLQRAASDTDNSLDQDIGSTVQEIVRPPLLKLVDAIDRAFLYASSESYGQSTARIFLFGQLARWPEGASLLSKLCSTPVHVMNHDLLPFDQGPNEQGSQACDAGLAIACGLALRGLEND